MSAPRTLAVITAGLSQPSSTRLLADRLSEAAARALADDGIQVKVTVIELRDLAHEITDHLLTGFAPRRLAEAIETVTRADGVIAVTPIFTTSYSGLFKSFIDVLDPASLIGTPVLLGATGGTERHSLALDYALRPLFAYLRTTITPTAVFAASGDWGATGDAGAAGLPDRIARAAAEFAAIVRSSGARVVKDPFALPAGFNPAGLAPVAAPTTGTRVGGVSAA